MINLYGLFDTFSLYKCVLCLFIEYVFFKSEQSRHVVNSAK